MPAKRARGLVRIRAHARGDRLVPRGCLAAADGGGGPREDRNPTQGYPAAPRTRPCCVRTEPPCACDARESLY